MTRVPERAVQAGAGEPRASSLIAADASSTDVRHRRPAYRA